MCRKEQGDGRPAIGRNFVFIRCSGLVEACDEQEVGPFEQRAEQSGGLVGIGHVETTLSVQVSENGFDLGDDPGSCGIVMKLAQRALVGLVAHDHGLDAAEFRTQQLSEQGRPHRHQLVFGSQPVAFGNRRRDQLFAASRDGGAEQRLFIFEVPIDAELRYLRPLGDLIEGRRLKPQLGKEFAGRVDDGLAERLVGGSTTPRFAGSGHENYSP